VGVATVAIAVPIVDSGGFQGECAVRSFAVVVGDVDAEDVFELAAAEDEQGGRPTSPRASLIEYLHPTGCSWSLVSSVILGAG
jgi:hypothetical protein